MPPRGVYRPGTHTISRGVYVYICPVCRKELRFDDLYEPCCTGPSETRDEHDLTVMQVHRIEPRLIQV
jgi:hypothetical protein